MIRLTVVNKLIIAYIGISLLITISGSISLNAFLQIEESFEGGEEHFSSIVIAATEASSWAKQAETHLLLYLITNTEGDREEFHSRHTALLEQIAILDDGVRVPEAQSILSLIKSESDRTLILGNSLLEAYDIEVKTEGRFEPAEYEELIQEFHRAASNVRQYAIELSEFNIGIEIDKKESAIENMRFIRRSIMIAIVFVLITAAIIGYYMTQSISKPIEKFKKAIAEYSKGNLTRRVDIESKDEFGQLANAFNDMTNSLNESIEKLKSELHKRSEFTRGLAHELKTPITPVIAGSELLLDEITDNRLKGLALSVNRGAQNLNNRINELLDLARSEVNAIVLNYKQLDVAQLLRNIHNDLSPVASTNSLSFILELPPSVPTVWADEDRLQQVILNLINNAFAYTSPGGRVILRAMGKDDDLVIEVVDTGRGISKKDQRTIFDPYQRKPSDKERLSGLGLGLSISKNLVELHGGKIWLSSKIGKGTTVSFSLPLIHNNSKGVNDYRE
ncbi:ATP-binding protein [Chloroflexota bacterium]